MTDDVKSEPDDATQSESSDSRERLVRRKLLDAAEIDALVKKASAL